MLSFCSIGYLNEWFILPEKELHPIYSEGTIRCNHSDKANRPAQLQQVDGSKRKLAFISSVVPVTLIAVVSTDDSFSHGTALDWYPVLSGFPLTAAINDNWWMAIVKLKMMKMFAVKPTWSIEKGILCKWSPPPFYDTCNCTVVLLRWIFVTPGA